MQTTSSCDSLVSTYLPINPKHTLWSGLGRANHLMECLTVMRKNYVLTIRNNLVYCACNSLCVQAKISKAADLLRTNTKLLVWSCDLTPIDFSLIG